MIHSKDVKTARHSCLASAHCFTAVLPSVQMSNEETVLQNQGGVRARLRQGRAGQGRVGQGRAGQGRACVALQWQSKSYLS